MIGSIGAVELLWLTSEGNGWVASGMNGKAFVCCLCLFRWYINIILIVLHSFTAQTVSGLYEIKESLRTIFITML